MKGLPIWITLTLLQFYKTTECAETPGSFENDKITYVQIKPLTEKKLPKNPELFRSSRIENIQIRGSAPQQKQKSPHPEVIRTPRSEDSVQDQSTEQQTTFTDYIDQANESEARFDTSEAVVPTGELEQTLEKEENKISPSQENDLYKYYSKNFKLKSAPKKYYKNYDTNSSYRKYLERRQYRSRCRCERIWNCPKLQISVPRCPADYFMCCF